MEKKKGQQQSRNEQEEATSRLTAQTIRVHLYFSTLAEAFNDGYGCVGGRVGLQEFPQPEGNSLTRSLLLFYIGNVFWPPEVTILKNEF